MAAFGRLTVENLLNTYLEFPDSLKAEPGLASFTLSLAIIRHFLGDAWIIAHLDTSSRTDGFMRLDLRDPIGGYIQRFKVIDLAELLFNLQKIAGFEAFITHMRTEKLIEGTLAELDIGRMLYVHNYSFRFVKRTYVKSADYDLEINLDKWTVCAEVKCKLENTAITSGTVIDALMGGRGQLPRNKPGMLFVKVPQNWMDKYLHAQLMADSARTYFTRGTQRIVSVKFYIAPFHFTNGVLSQTHKFKEVANPRNRFDPHRSWELFTRRASTGIPPTILTTVPRKWLRLINFPDGIKDYEER
jgi:hypothetical protein